MNIVTLKKPDEAYAIMGFTRDGFFSGAISAPAGARFESIVNSITILSFSTVRLGYSDADVAEYLGLTVEKERMVM